MTKITLTVGGHVISGTINEDPAGREFASLFPLTVDLSDYASTEKVSSLPSTLPIEGAPEGAAARVGDITYYSPWGNLAIFYKPFKYSAGLIKLGSFDASPTTLRSLTGEGLFELAG